MALFTDIKEVRIRISDPYKFINFLEVANPVSLPTSPASQTAYKDASTGSYYSTVEDSPVTVPDDYEIQELRMSDERISAWIDYDGVNYATCRALKQIVAQLGEEKGGLKKTSTGAEDTEYNSIKDLYYYYKSLLNDCKKDLKEAKGNSTGRVGKMSSPEIAGGNL